MNNSIYESPLSGRYCSKEAKELSSEVTRWTSIRVIWFVVLRAQNNMGLVSVSNEALNKFGKVISDEVFDWGRIKEIEKVTKHDVKAHIEYLGELIPELSGKIHVGMTSEDATSNGEQIVNFTWIASILEKLGIFIANAKDTMLKYKNVAIIGETHLQPASLVTIGKRIAMWIGPLIQDFEELEKLEEKFRSLKGARGATGTYDAMFELCNSDLEKLKEFRREVFYYLAIEMGDSKVFQETDLVPGQTQHRNLDYELVFRFASIAANIGKMATDIRHMSENGEVGEPRSKGQVGSSAMPHKRNPMKCERINSLARNTIGYLNSALITQHIQGLERTLDDSAGRRSYMAESFLTVDAILILANEVISGLQVFEANCERRVRENLPFLSGEKAMMNAIKRGENREEVHEFFKEKAMEVFEEIANGKMTENDLFDRILYSEYAENTLFIEEDLPDLSDISRFTGISEKLCEDFAEVLEEKVISHLSDVEDNMEKSEV